MPPGVLVRLDEAPALDRPLMLGEHVRRWGPLVEQVVTGRRPLEAHEELLVGRQRGTEDVLAVAP